MAAKKSTTSKKTATKKAAARKTATKKVAAGKTATKKAAARKTSTTKAPAKKTAVKKATSRKSVVKKAIAKKAAPKKAIAKKAAPKKAIAKKAAPKKAAPKKAPAATTPSPPLDLYKTALAGKTVDDLKAMLRANDQLTGGNRTELVERILDRVVNGNLPRCPKCYVGRLRVSSKGRYSCPGGYDDDEYQECNFTAKAGDVERPAWQVQAPGGVV